MKTKLQDFDFSLPDELIALSPTEPRDHCRLLILDKNTGALREKQFFDIIEEFQPGDVLVLNDIKVDKARLPAIRANGTVREVLLISTTDQSRWLAMTTQTKRLKIGETLQFGPGLDASLSEKRADGKLILTFNRPVTQEDLERLGKLPLPPYIQSKRPYLPQDNENYQTVYARHQGAKAAPTAGLHFTPRLLRQCEEKGVRIVSLQLYVSLGTFEPIKTEFIEDHTMHLERFHIPLETAQIINSALREKRRIIAVGTTVVRSLESAFDGQNVKSGEGETGIFIYPGYQFKTIQALITNFHTPGSSLLLLVSALAGRDKLLNAYRHAIKEKFHFFSYGDAMFIK